MTVFRKEQFSFTAGVFSQEAQHRSDLQERWNQGAARGDNLLINPLGPMKKRAGLRFVTRPEQFFRILKPFIFNRQEKYLFGFRDGLLDIFRPDGGLEAQVGAPWTEARLRQIGITQFGDVMLVFHDAYETRQIARQAAGSWTQTAWPLTRTDAGRIQEPQFRYADPQITINKNRNNNPVTFTAREKLESTNPAFIFNTGHVGTQWRIKDNTSLKAHLINLVPASSGGTEDPNNPGWYDTAEGQVLGGDEQPAGTDETADWTEPQWSPVRGWPKDGKLQQNRLACAGGARPLTVNYSTARDVFEFNLGDGEDDDSVDFTLGAETLDPILRLVVLARRLLALTSVSEWATGDELITPKNPGPATFSAYGAEDVAAVLMENGILFAGEDRETGGGAIFEAVYNELDGLLVQNISILAGDLIRQPVEIVVRKRLGSTQVNHAFVINNDGSCAVLNSLRQQGLIGWTRITAGGPDAKIISGAVLDGEIYFVVQRAGGYSIECLDDTYRLDMSQKYTSATPQTTWTVDAMYNGQTLQVVADDTWWQTVVPASGQITLQTAASAIEIGYEVSWALQTLPPPMEQVPSLRRRQDALIADQAAVLLGPSDGVLIEGAPLPGRTPGGGWGSPVLLQTGWHSVQGLQGENGQVTLSGNEPWPVEIRALMVWWQA